MGNRVKPLDASDRRHLEAAKGWCQLEAFLEANEELEQITANLRAHPDVLKVRWQIYANLEKWEGALEIAGAIVTLVPNKPEGWIYKASSLHELRRDAEAHEVLLDTATRFPSDEIVLYDLACVCCSMKRLDEARSWLSNAVAAGGDKIKLRASKTRNLNRF